jgi:hypothetical protein
MLLMLGRQPSSSNTKEGAAPVVCLHANLETSVGPRCPLPCQERALWILGRGADLRGKVAQIACPTCERR